MYTESHEWLLYGIAPESNYSIAFGTLIPLKIVRRFPTISVFFFYKAL